MDRRGPAVRSDLPKLALGGAIGRVVIIRCSDGGGCAAGRTSGPSLDLRTPERIDDGLDPHRRSVIAAVDLRAQIVALKVVHIVLHHDVAAGHRLEPAIGIVLPRFHGLARTNRCLDARSNRRVAVLRPEAGSIGRVVDAAIKAIGRFSCGRSAYGPAKLTPLAVVRVGCRDRWAVANVSRTAAAVDAFHRLLEEMAEDIVTLIIGSRAIGGRCRLAIAAVPGRGRVCRVRIV